MSDLQPRRCTILTLPSGILLDIIRNLCHERTWFDPIPSIGTASCSYSPTIFLICKTLHPLACRVLYVETPWRVEVGDSLIARAREKKGSDASETEMDEGGHVEKLIPQVRSLVSAFAASPIGQSIRSLELCVTVRAPNMLDPDRRSCASLEIIEELWRCVCEELTMLGSLRAITFSAHADLDVEVGVLNDRWKEEWEEEWKEAVRTGDMIGLLRDLRIFRERGVTVKSSDSYWRGRTIDETEIEEYMEEILRMSPLAVD